jgi:uncharacterized protein YecE (DUF72 family)
VIPPTIGTRIGIAGWSIPKLLRRDESQEKSLLQQYGELFNATEINSSFYRPHRFQTYQRWAASVPDNFRFSVKVPRLLTHERRLIAGPGEIRAFMAAVRGLADKLGVLLVQLPPRFVFDERVARRFFDALGTETAALIACEARNPSWFMAEANHLLHQYRVARVIADPVPRGCETAASPNTLPAYLRLHGSPHMYYSSYSWADLQTVSGTLRALNDGESWCIFDNTAAGAAWHDAPILQRLLANTTLNAQSTKADLPRALG